MGRPVRVALHPLTDALMGVSSGAMTSVFRGRIRPHGLQVLRGPGPGDTGIHGTDRKRAT